MIQSLSKNVDKVYGVCASPNLVFYTGGSRNDFAVPRGCVWDGDGTVFLADKGGDAVWSFPSSMHGLGLVQASKLFEVQDPYGVAVFRPRLALETGEFLRAGAMRLGSGFASLVVVLMFSIIGLHA